MNMEESAIKYIEKLEDMVDRLMDNAQVKQEEVDELMDELEETVNRIAVLEKELWMTGNYNHTPYHEPPKRRPH